MQLPGYQKTKTCLSPLSSTPLEKQNMWELQNESNDKPWVRWALGQQLFCQPPMPNENCSPKVGDDDSVEDIM